MEEMVLHELRQWLFDEAAEGYKKFSAGLIPGCDNMLGVRIPVLRKKAKEIAKGNFRAFLSESEDIYFEETMIAGMVIGYARVDIEERISLFADFIPRIHNWSVNDCVCATIKLKPTEYKPFWDFLMRYRESEEEFEIRVVAVMLMDQYLIPEYIEEVLSVLNSLQDEKYYASMAIAWALATAYAKFPEETLTLLQGENSFSDATFNRAIQKMTESYRVPKEDKEMLRKMKRKETH